MWRPGASLALALTLAACSTNALLPVAAGYGPAPTLPAPQHQLIPTVHIAWARGWPAGAMPKVANDLRIQAFAQDLEHPRWLYTLPNGDVLVAETDAPPKSEGGKGLRGWIAGLVMKKAGSGNASANRITLLRDSDGDGVADVLLMNGGVLSDGDISYTGAFTTLSTLGSASGFTVGGVGDFNGDGTSDILLQSNGVFVDYTVKNGAVTGGSLVGSAAGWTVGGVGDFNGDGTSDILLQNNGSFTIWDMKNGALTQGYSLTPLPGWSVVGTGDFNGDSTTDILLQSGGTLVDYIIHNNAVAWGNLLSTSLAGWTVVGTGDYDGDGTSDILLQAGSTVVDYTMHGGLVQSGAVFGSTGGLQVVGK